MAEKPESMHPTPGEHHLRLKPMEGTFRSEVKIWIGKPAPMISTGTMINSFQVGGLYLQQEYTGDPNEGPLPAFVGKGYWGYNTTANEYEGFWIDNASTIMQMEKGNVDETGTVWEMLSEVTTPGGTMKKRTLITLIDDNNHKLEAFFTTADGAEMKTMEISYTRA